MPRLTRLSIAVFYPSAEVPDDMDCDIYMVAPKLLSISAIYVSDIGLRFPLSQLLHYSLEGTFDAT